VWLKKYIPDKKTDIKKEHLFSFALIAP